jgi:L,D-peptidoglycan transpeptidase YkuD (ErfK/YbiS/YcfS/YnhG family)
MTAGLRSIRVTAEPGATVGTLVAGGMRAPCALGRAGIVRNKREGDGGTPIGTHRLIGVLYRPDRLGRPVTRLPVAPIHRNDGWCDDPADRRYNRPVRLPLGASHERLWRDDNLYDVVVILAFNLLQPIANMGSAIFLHLAKPAFAPTAGCVAVDLPTMRRLLFLATPKTAVAISQTR